jgi:hypothetical protein
MDNKISEERLPLQTTALKWFIEKLNQCEPWYSGTGVPVDHIEDLIKEAKAMEWAQMQRDYEGGWIDGRTLKNRGFYDYIEETYGYL